jgi:hypothetical protein
MPKVTITREQLAVLAVFANCDSYKLTALYLGISQALVASRLKSGKRCFQVMGYYLYDAVDLLKLLEREPCVWEVKR